MKTKSNMIVTKPNNEYAKKLTKKQTKEMIYVIKNTPSPIKPNNEWEKEFDKEIGEIIFEDGNNITDAVKDFISKTLQEQRKDLIKEIEGIIGEDEKVENDGSYYNDYRIRNNFRHELLSKIKELNKEEDNHCQCDECQHINEL